MNLNVQTTIIKKRNREIPCVDIVESDVEDKFEDNIENVKKSQKYESVPWIEKYRPKTIDDLVTDDTTLAKIKKIIDEKDMPCIIFTGIPGIGKTTTILCIAKALLGKNYSKGILELNASDDRGIKAVQDTENFCKKKIDLNMDGEKKYANHKIILLDEADNMTKKAQRLVNNLMEQYYKTTRFAFTCNNSSDIIEAIQSRCIIFRYFRLNNSQIIKRLEQICKLENVTYTKDSLETISVIAQGDMRNAINTLQLIHCSYGALTTSNINKICDKPHPHLIKSIFIACGEKKPKLAFKLLYELKDKGFSGSDITLSMINVLKLSDFKEINDETKVDFLEKVCRTSYLISKGISTDLQLSGLLSCMLY